MYLQKENISSDEGENETMIEEVIIKGLVEANMSIG